MLAAVLTITSDDPAPWIIGLLALGAAGIAAVVLRGEADKRRVRAREIEMHDQQMTHQATQREREDRAYQQHTTLNDLHARKLELEARVLEVQLANAERDTRLREQNEEYHGLMVQKTQLEIQSLRLHIREQQKRGEDFSSGYDEE